VAERLDVHLIVAALIGDKGQPFAVGREHSVLFIQAGGDERARSVNIVEGQGINIAVGVGPPGEDEEFAVGTGGIGGLYGVAGGEAFFGATVDARTGCGCGWSGNRSRASRRRSRWGSVSAGEGEAGEDAARAIEQPDASLAAGTAVARFCPFGETQAHQSNEDLVTGHAVRRNG
jgi:hypothetical protein